MTSNNMTHRSHNHKHPLVVVDGERRYKCDGCEMEGVGKRYSCKRCNFNLHHNCMFPSTTITVQGQECHFHETPPLGIRCRKANSKCRSCDACGMTIMGFVYHCPETDCDFHPTCAKLETKISIEDVTFTLQTKQGPSDCALCKRKLLKGAVKKIPGWSYVAEDEDYNMHVYCFMDMVMQLQSSSSSNINGGHNGDRGLSLALKGTTTELPLKNKSKKMSTTNKWLKILKIFIGTVFSILLGDPTTLIASTMAHFVVEGLFHAAG